VLGLRDLVYAGAVAPGERLSEVSISERLGLSRTPVRAALARMEQEGILEAIPSGGYAVRSFTEADVHDAIELRGTLEGMAARLAAERGVQPARLVAMKALVAKLDNAEFHEMLAGLSGSTIAKRELDRAKQLPFADPSAFLTAQAHIPAFRASLFIGQAQHRAIVAAIEMREGARAEALAREHARLARQNLEFVMTDRRLVERVPGLMLVSG
jgi:GntR family transcriptional regulator, vanillate catabolism transcriptional regulator